MEEGKSSNAGFGACFPPPIRIGEVRRGDVRSKESRLGEYQGWYMLHRQDAP